MKILDVTVKHTVDSDPDTSWIGKYTDDLRPGVIVRQESEFYEKLPAEMERDTDGRFLCKGSPDVPDRGREYRGFIPYAGGEKVGTKLYYKYGMQDFERMESLCNGTWCFLGISAEARVQLNSDVVQTIHSGGLWGIESNATEYHVEVEQEELSALRKELESIGFTDEAITEAFSHVDREDD